MRKNWTAKARERVKRVHGVYYGEFTGQKIYIY